MIICYFNQKSHSFSSEDDAKKVHLLVFADRNFTHLKLLASSHWLKQLNYWKTADYVLLDIYISTPSLIYSCQKLYRETFW